jgi:hypothetical protein
MFTASKIKEGKWGIFYHQAGMGSFGPKVTFRTKREAERKARDWNEAEMVIRHHARHKTDAAPRMGS